MATVVDTIGGFPYAEPNCRGCGNPLVVENAWMTDGCPCNTPLGVNSLNETRWRLLMTLQQRQSHDLKRARQGEGAAMRALRVVPGDVILIEHPGILSNEQIERFAKCLRDNFPGTRAVVLDQGATLRVARPTA